MNWRPISKENIGADIDSALPRMSLKQKKLWEIIRIDPEKWLQDPWGTEGEGFWVVAILGKTVIWYNDIEEGYNRSSYATYGKISEYWCNQDQLEWVLHQILKEINDGHL